MINKNTVLNFFFPQKCPVCRTIIKLGEEGSVMCPVCRLKWGYEKEKLCTECSLPAYLCTCMPKRMSTAGALDLLKLCFYDSNSGSAGDRLVLYMKDYRDRRVFRYVALELCAHLKKYLDKNGISTEEIVITYSPRSRSMLEKRGFDQAKHLAKECAKEMNADFVDAIRRRFFSKRQKGLSVKERQENAKHSFEIRKNIDLKRKTVILVDDVVTTGASFAACTKLLLKEGAVGVVCLAVAQSNGK